MKHKYQIIQGKKVISEWRILDNCLMAYKIMTNDLRTMDKKYSIRIIVEGIDYEDKH